MRTLLLPHAIALSDGEVTEIARFGAEGGTVLADGEPGLFDGHGRRRDRLPLPDVRHPQAVRPDGEEADGARLVALAGLLADRPRVRMEGPDGQLATGVEARWFRGAEGEVLALQAGRAGGAPGRVLLRFAGAVRLTDLRRGGVVAGMEVAIDPVEPTVLLVAPVQ